MQQTNIIGDTTKNRRINYDLIDRLNKECEVKARKVELEGRLTGKKKEKEEEEKEETGAVPTIPQDINYIKTPDELREIKGNYSLQKGIYTIDFEIIVPSDKTLILLPGVKLYFTKDGGITCEGRFEAKGKDGLEVLLTAKDENERWKNLYLKSGAEGILNYAKFSLGSGRKDREDDICGGAILLRSKYDLKPSLIINHSCFKNNSARYGGGIFNYEGNLIIGEKNIFGMDSADLRGGAIYNYKGNTIIKENNIFENNIAELSGGAIHNYRGDITIEERNIFEKNYAKNGGAIRNYYGKLNIDEAKNIFRGNSPDDISQE